MSEFLKDVAVGAIPFAILLAFGRVVGVLTGRPWGDGTMAVVGVVLVVALLAYLGMMFRWWREFRR